MRAPETHHHHHRRHRHRQHQGRRQQQDEIESTRNLYDLCSMIIHILRFPPLPLPLPLPLPPVVSFPSLSLSLSLSLSRSLSNSPTHPQASPAAFASLFLGISVAMMLFGSVTFVIGFFLMPLVIAFVLLFYFIGMVYNLSELGRAILWPPSHSQ